MAQIKPAFPFLFILLRPLLLLTTVAPASSFSFSQYKTALSLFHSLLTRISNISTTRGDAAGSTRAKLLTNKLEGALGLLAWSFLLDYAWRRNFTNREVYGIVSELLWCKHSYVFSSGSYAPIGYTIGDTLKDLLKSNPASG